MDVLAYGKKLFSIGQELAQKGKYEEVAHNVFSEHNHGHSGWTLSTKRLFEYPQNEAELELRNAFIELLNETLRGIRDVLYPVSSPNDRPWLVEAAQICLEILGELAPDTFALREASDGVTPETGTITIYKKIHRVPRTYDSICFDEHDHLTIAEHLNVLEVKLIGELMKNGCKEHMISLFQVHPQTEIDMLNCPPEIRPHMREFWELLQSVRRVKKSSSVQ